MASALVTSLTRARDAYLAKLVALAEDSANHMTYSENGRSMTKTEYQTFLQATVEKLDKQINDHQPYMMRSRAW